ncbi:DUF5677 domain-containing protein [Bacillus luti]|uniref:DUF5677 domain-containing protein n=1 Tax=Bacillus luti TaxID=2026191 RepID=UPI003D649456
MSLEKTLDELGSVIQKGEEIFAKAGEKFSATYAITPDKVTTAALLFRKVIEKLDGIFILIENGASNVAKSLVRDLFENVLYLKFMLDESHFERRANAYYFAYFKNQHSFAYSMSSQNEKGIEVRRYLKKELPDQMINEQKNNAKAQINKGYLKNIKIEWERLARKKKYPTWYSLFNGPKTIREMAIQLGYGAVYDTVYNFYSREVHSGNVYSQLTEIEGEKTGIYQLRNFENVDSIVSLSKTFGMQAIKIFSDFFELESKEDFKSWYKENFKIL